MSGWITDRAPTEKDTDKSAIWLVWTTYNGEVIAWTYDGVAKGIPWMPISKPEPYVSPKPEPYVKPKRWQIEWVSQYHQWVVRDTEGHIGAVLCSDSPSPEKYREAAERIAAIYNEVMQ